MFIVHEIAHSWQLSSAVSQWPPQLSMNAFSHVATELGTSQWLDHFQRDRDCPWNLLFSGVFFLLLLALWGFSDISQPAFSSTVEVYIVLGKMTLEAP